MNDFCERQSFVDMVVGLCRWWEDHEAELSLEELDINPVMFDREGAVVADALAVAADP